MYLQTVFLEQFLTFPFVTNPNMLINITRHKMGQAGNQPTEILSLVV
jgi:hypothetical protein